MNFNEAILFRYIKDLKKEDAIDIGINELTYYRLKDDPKYIYETKSSTLIKILTLSSDILDTIIVGIDVNSKDLFAASTQHFKTTYTSGLDVSKIYKKEHQLNRKSLLHQFKTSAGQHIKKLFNILPSTETPIIFVIGEYNSNNYGAWSCHHQAIIDLLIANMKNTDKIYMIDEHNTSRTCPKCNHVSKLNRKDNNSFICCECGFTHHNDDIVAAQNIAEKFASGTPAIRIK